MSTQVAEPTYSASYLASLPETTRTEFVDALTDEQALFLRYDWRFWARDKQLPPPGDWTYWFIMAGRGWGKTRTGAEFIRAEVERLGAVRVALVGATAADVRDVMLEGESGLLNIYPPGQAPMYEPSKRRLTWRNGAQATTYAAETPDRLRGPGHHIFWADEPASWRYCMNAWDMLQFGLRLGRNPRGVVTTTPRPIRLVKQLVADPMTALTTGSTYENRANLAPPFMRKIIQRYEGTRLGRQEIYAEVLEDVPGALWRRDTIERHRAIEAPPLDRVVVAVDPATTKKRDSDETGIVACGRMGDVGYVLEDRTFRGSPLEWATVAIMLYFELEASALVVEDNQGGDMTETTLRTAAVGLAEKGEIPHGNINVQRRTATRSKQARAEPISALYEQGRIYHVGMLPELEDQMCTWVPGEGDSPDRVDALVWALTELMLQSTSWAWAVI